MELLPSTVTMSYDHFAYRAVDHSKTSQSQPVVQNGIKLSYSPHTLHCAHVCHENKLCPQRMARHTHRFQWPLSIKPRFTQVLCIMLASTTYNNLSHYAIIPPIPTLPLLILPLAYIKECFPPSSLDFASNILDVYPAKVVAFPFSPYAAHLPASMNPPLCSDPPQEWAIGTSFGLFFSPIIANI